MQIASNLLAAVLLFFIQPIFVIGLISAIISGRNRLHFERKSYRVAIYRSFYEVRNFLTLGLISGLAASALIVLIGIPLTLDWIIAYQVISLLLFVFGYRFIHPVFSFPLAVSVVAAGVIWNDQFDFSFLPGNWYQPFTQSEWVIDRLVLNVLVILTILLFLWGMTFRKYAGSYLTPRFLKTKRGKRVARYRLKPFWVIPLLLIVPGDSFRQLFDWWPVFSLGNQTFSFILLPVLSGMRFTIQAQLPKEATSRMANDFLILSAIASVAVIVSNWIPYASAIGLGLVFLGGSAVLIRHRKREKQWSFLYGPSDKGLKIVAVRLNTPAAKMDLTVGDTIVLCNDLPVETENDFYQALSTNSVYCRLKIKGLDGENRLTETALYADSPHELGVVLLPNND